MKLKEIQEKYYEIKEELEDRRRHRALVDVCRAFNPELDEETEVLVGEGRVRFCQYRDNLLLIKLYYVMGKDFPIVLEGEVKIRDKVSLAKVWIGDDFSFGQSKSGVRYEERKVYEVKDREKVLKIPAGSWETYLLGDRWPKAKQVLRERSGLAVKAAML